MTTTISRAASDESTADAASALPGEDQGLGPTCAGCGAGLTDVFVDLGAQPLSQGFLTVASEFEAEPTYPLRAYVCRSCYLVQVPSSVSPADIFTEYAYFSSYSDSWLEHARQYVDQVTERFGLNGDSFVLELASNDGYLLRNFVARQIPCLGIEPALNVASAAIREGVPTLSEFFGRALGERLASEGQAADLVVANNVLAQCPDVHDFVAGIAEVLKPEGVFTVEFPHLPRLITGRQFDTIYHEHFFYFSFMTARAILGQHGLHVFDVEELPTHGGSLRIYASRDTARSHEESPRVAAMEAQERAFGVASIERYTDFQEQVVALKRSILRFLMEAQETGRHVAAYGAPAKGNTLLNYCGIRSDAIAYEVDRNPAKQGLMTPGTRIPIHAPEHLRETRPDFVVVMPWNLVDEVVSQHRYVEEWGGRFVTFLPGVRILEPSEGAPDGAR